MLSMGLRLPMRPLGRFPTRNSEAKAPLPVVSVSTLGITKEVS